MARSGLGTFALLLSLLTVAPLWAATSTVTPPPRTIEATPLLEANAIRLDGELTERVWLEAVPITNFVQRDPHEGSAPSFPTEARVAYDDSAVYVAVRAWDPEPDKIVGILTRRDGQSPSDWIRILIDSYHDHRTAFEFAVNAAGVKQDKYRYNDTNEDLGWDAVWDVVVTRDDQGWQAEFRIPFSQLRFQREGVGSFGFAVIRQIGRLNETSTWPLLPKGANGFVSSFGELTGIRIERNPKRLELVPYVVGQVGTWPSGNGNPFSKSVDPHGAFGADMKYALTPALTLTATVNPDFGQVEADPAVVNLSAFETFFEERRPFFVEGSGVFRFDLECNDGRCTGLFYSRRIGRAPQGRPDVPLGGYSSLPSQTTILGAAKLTGRAGGFALGALNAVTSEENAHVATGMERYRHSVEPLTNYSVVRARREFASQSSLGFMATATNRRLSDTTRFLPGQAYTGGVDWDIRLRRSTYSVRGYWAGSTVRGTDDAIARLQLSSVHGFQRPDAGHVEFDPERTSLHGQTASLSFSKIAGHNIRFNTNGGFRSPGFDVNDIGFLRRADQAWFSNWLQWRRDRFPRYLRSFSLNLNQWNGWNLDGDRIFGGGNVNAHAVFTSNWRTGVGVNFEMAALNDRLTRGGPAGRDNGFRSIWSYVGSDDRKAIAVEAQQFMGTDRHGSTVFDFNPSIRLRPSDRFSLSGGLGFNRRMNDYQWVGKVSDAGDHYVFGRLRQTTMALRTRLNYTVTPALSLQVYAEPFVSAGEYGAFKELIDGRAERYGDRFASFAYRGAPDFNYRSFRTTNVLRWEYRPGSTLFVVWQQGREESGGNGEFRFGRDFRYIFDAPAHNVFLVKFSYWLNL
jgi:hypothetical protein